MVLLCGCAEQASTKATRDEGLFLPPASLPKLHCSSTSSYSSRSAKSLITCVGRTASETISTSRPLRFAKHPLPLSGHDGLETHLPSTCSSSQMRTCSLPTCSCLSFLLPLFPLLLSLQSLNALSRGCNETTCYSAEVQISTEGERERECVQLGGKGERKRGCGGEDRACACAYVCVLVRACQTEWKCENGDV